MCNTLRRLALVLVLVAAAGCSPRFDWRDMPAADGAVQVTFPARPQTQTRALALADASLPFTLTAAQVDEATFAVGHVRLPDAVDAAGREAYRIALQDSLVHNLQAADSTERAVMIRRTGHSVRPAIAAHELEVSGTPNGKPVWLLARIVTVGDRLVQVVAIGSPDTLSHETARIFIDSLRVP